MTETGTPARLVESLFRFSAALTAFGYQQVCNVLVRPTAILNTVGPLREAMDSAADVLSKPPAMPITEQTSVPAVSEIPDPAPLETHKPGKVRARKK